MARRWLSVAALGLAAAGACFKKEPRGGATEDQNAGSPARSTLDGTIVYAELDVDTVLPPARYGAPLPATVEAANGDWSEAPPARLVRRRLCAGDGATRARVLTALRAAASTGATEIALRDAYAPRLFSACSSPELCDWLVTSVGHNEPPGVKAVLWQGLQHCTGPRVSTAFALGDAPPAAFLAWYVHRDTVPPHDERAAFALRRLVAAVPGDDPLPRPLLEAAARFATVDDPRAFAVATEVYGRATTTRGRAQILWPMAADRRTEPRAFFDRHCAEGTENLCEHGRAARERDPVPTRAPSDGDDPTGESLSTRLDALGFPARPGAAPPPDRDTPADSAAALLRRRGYLHRFDVETGTFPNEHQVLLETLAQLVSPDLDGVLFEEEPPKTGPDGEKLDPDGGYTLVAYASGKRYRVPAQDKGDWYDLEAVLGLLNTLARAETVEARFVALRTEGQTAEVLGAPPSAIEAAVREGLVEIADTREPERAGKSFERRVLEWFE